VRCAWNVWRKLQELVDRVGLRDVRITARIQHGKIRHVVVGAEHRPTVRPPGSACRVPTEHRKRRRRAYDFETEIKPMLKLRLSRLLRFCDIEHGGFIVQVTRGVVVFVTPAPNFVACNGCEVESLARFFEKANHAAERSR